MRYELYDFQEDAVIELIKKMKRMQSDWHEYGEISSVALTAPTGAGKTIICAAVAEGLFVGAEQIMSDPNAVILWLSDNPALNKQTCKRFSDASDMLNEISDMFVIEPDFAKSHNKLERHKVYFLNRQKLVGNLGKSAEGSRTFWDVLKNTIEDPSINLYLMIDEAHKGLGYNADEKTTSDEQNKTIYAKLIDGQKDLNPPMPVVVGISATISRWNKSMELRKNRDKKAAVEISNEKVRKAGIIKKLIELRSPKVTSNVKEQDLIAACRKLSEFTDHWKAYYDKCGGKLVIPLMVVQTEDNISDASLHDICRTIKAVLPDLDSRTAFANVFGEHKNRGNEYFNVPYVSPDEVQEKTDIRVLFAKDAISTGWDCPRAEVLYSRRKRQDKTYIHQMFGRMIRTPLAKKIEDDDFLNKVVCYLPEYDTKSVEEIVELIKNDSDIGDTTDVSSGDTEACWFSGAQETAAALIDTVSAAQAERSSDNKGTGVPATAVETTGGLFDYDSAFTKAVDSIVNESYEQNSFLPDGIKFNKGGNKAPEQALFDNPDNGGSVSNVPVKKTVIVDTEKLKAVVNNMPTTKSVEENRLLRESFEGISSRYVEKKDRDKFVQLFKVVNFLVETKYPDSDISWEDDVEIQKQFCESIEYAIKTHQKQFDESLKNILFRKQRVTKVDTLTGRKYVESVDESIRIEQIKLFSVATSAMVKFCTNRFNNDDYVKGYIQFLKDGFNINEEDGYNRLAAVISCNEAMAWLEDWAVRLTQNLIKKHDKNKGRLSANDLSRWDQILDDTQNWNEQKLMIPSGTVGQNTNYKAYKKHLIASPNGNAYISLSPLEDHVVSQEISDPYNVAWYRNPSYRSNSSLSLVYEIGKDLLKNFFPDFIFFERTNDGKIIRNIIDPHGDWIGDSIPRLRGYITYLRDHPDDFAKVLAITEVAKGNYRYLDLKDPDVIKAVEGFTGTMAKELFTGPFSRSY